MYEFLETVEPAIQAFLFVFFLFSFLMISYFSIKNYIAYRKAPLLREVRIENDRTNFVKNPDVMDYDGMGNYGRFPISENKHKK